MILRAELCNSLQDNSLDKPMNGCCTYSCTRVELSSHLAELIMAWPTLTEDQRRGLSLILRVG